MSLADYSGSPVLIGELLLEPEALADRPEPHSRLGVETTNGDGFGVGWLGSGRTLDFLQRRAGLERPEPA